MTDRQPSDHFEEKLDAVMGGDRVSPESSDPDRPILKISERLAQAGINSDPAHKAALRQRLLAQARKEFPRRLRIDLVMNPIRQFSKLTLPVLALIIIGLGLAWLIPSLRPVSVPAVGKTSTIVPTSTIIPSDTDTKVPPTLVPTRETNILEAGKTVDGWDPNLYHPIFKKWVNSYPAFSPGPFSDQRLTLADFADGHQVLTSDYCEPEDSTIVLLDATRRCMMIQYSDEKQELTLQAFMNCSKQCLNDLQEVKVQGTTAYLGWSESGAGGNWTELHWRLDGVTITMALFGDWPQPDRTNPHRLDEMLMWLADSLGQQNQPVSTPYLPSDWRLIFDPESGLTYGVPKSWQANGGSFQGSDGFVKLEPFTGPGVQMDEICEAEANRSPQAYGKTPYIFSMPFDTNGGNYNPCLILPDRQQGPAAQATILIPDPASTDVLRILALHMDSFHAMMVAYTLQFKLPDRGIFKRTSTTAAYATPGPNQLPKDAKMETVTLPGLMVEAYPVIDASLDAPGHLEFSALVPPVVLDKRKSLRQLSGKNLLNPIQIDGHTYSVAEISENNQTESAQVSEDGSPIFKYHLLIHGGVTPIFRLGDYQGKWALEVNGMLVVDGQVVNAAWGYQEIFHWQELNGKVFFFFVKDGKTGIRYGDQELPGLYDLVFHHYCCEPAAFNVAGNDQMVWFYALKGAIWYYAEAFIP